MLLKRIVTLRQGLSSDPLPLRESMWHCPAGFGGQQEWERTGLICLNGGQVELGPLLQPHPSCFGPPHCCRDTKDGLRATTGLAYFTPIFANHA